MGSVSQGALTQATAQPEIGNHGITLRDAEPVFAPVAGTPVVPRGHHLHVWATVWGSLTQAGVSPSQLSPYDGSGIIPHPEQSVAAL